MNIPASFALLQEALALHRRGELREARERYQRLLRSDPRHGDAPYYLALIAYQQSRYDDCLRLCRRALAGGGPPQPRLHCLMGLSHGHSGNHVEALAAFDRAVEIDPNHADAHGHRANTLADLGRPQLALAAYDRALSLKPDSPEDWCNRANVLVDLGRVDDAIASLDHAIVLEPKDAQYHVNRARILADFGRLEEALASDNRALALEPKMAEAYTHSGLLLRNLGRLDEARARLDRSVTLQPDRPDTFVHRGNVLREAGRLAEASADYQRALDLDQQCAEAHMGLAQVLLVRGEWDAGWRHFEYRELLAPPLFGPLPYPRWIGAPLGGERLVLVADHGLGDTIQFSRFAAMLAADGADVTILARAGMRPLLSSLSGVTIATTAEELRSERRPMRWLPLMSVPGVLGILPETVPADVPYLSAEPSRVAAWAQQLGGSFNIGINWAAAPSGDWHRSRRNVPLAAFADLADIPGGRLVSLQKGKAVHDIQRVPFGDRILTLDLDPGSDSKLFLDTAAAMTQLDLIVTCDTAVAHLAGALARPVFTALPSAADCRWNQGGPTTPWYPTMTLFRQRSADNWTDPFAQIALAVRAMMHAQAA